MGDQWEMGKGVYEADSGDVYVCGLRLEQIAAGGFPQVDNSISVDLPRTLTMRYVIGYDTFTGAKQKLFVASQTDPLWTSTSPPATFIYGPPSNQNTFTVASRIGERNPKKF